MLTKLQQVTLVVQLLWFSVFLNSAFAQNDLSAAEGVATSYMTAFFHGDMETAANLTHQDTLENLKRTYLLELDKAQSEDRIQQFLAKAGVKSDPNTLRQMSPHDLFVTLVGSNQKRASDATLQAMKHTVVKVERSELVSPNVASVHLKILIPKETGTVNQSGGLLLAKQGGIWRVKSNLP